MEERAAGDGSTVSTRYSKITLEVISSSSRLSKFPPKLSTVTFLTYEPERSIGFKKSSPLLNLIDFPVIANVSFSVLSSGVYTLAVT